MLAGLRAWAGRLKRDVIALWIAARSAETPRAARVIAALVAAYALSPIDLIPDFVPVLGLLDDLLIVPLGIALALRCIPPPLLARFRAEAMRRDRPTSRGGAMCIVAIWLLGAGAAALWWFRRSA